MVDIALGPKEIKRLLKQLVIFYLSSFAFGGCAFALLYFIKPQDVLIKNGVYIGTYPIKIALLGGILGFIIIQTAFKIVKTKLKPNEETTCSVKANTNDEVSAVGARIVLGSNLTLTSVTTDSAWQGDGNDGNIQLYIGENKKGNFNIATFKVKAGSVNTGADTSVSLNDVKLSDASFAETDFTVSSVGVRILSNINTLKTLTVSDGNFTFNKGTNNYELTIDKDNTTISATKDDNNSSISGDIGNKKLNYGLNTFTIKVTSESGIVNIYTLKINRPDNRSKDNYLLGFKFNNYNIDFSKDKTSYSLIVENKVTKLAICFGEVEDDTILCIDGDSLDISDKAKMESLFFNKQEIKDADEKCNADESICYSTIGNINVGNNELKMVVTAENEDKKEYVFTINRKNESGQVVDKTDDEITSNSKTGSTSIIIISIVMIIALVVAIVVAKKKGLFDKTKNN